MPALPPSRRHEAGSSHQVSSRIGRIDSGTKRMQSMQCPFMTHLLKKLDGVRAEQCNSSGNEDVHGKRKQLHAFEALLDRHVQTCPVCR